MKKRMLCMMLGMAMATGAMTGCGSGGEPAGSEKTDGNDNPRSSFCGTFIPNSVSVSSYGSLIWDKFFRFFPDAQS